MTNIQLVEHHAALRQAERRVVEAAEKWDEKIHSNHDTRIELHEAVGALKRLREQAVDGSGR